MTIDERKMAIAYGDLLCIQDLMQHILRMDADDLLSEDARKAFLCASMDMDKVASWVGKYMSEHTDFNAENDA